MDFYDKINIIHSNIFYLISMPGIFLISYYIIKSFPINPSNVSIDEIAKKISLAMGHFSPLKGLIVLIVTSISLGFGVPVGREGPIAKLGGVGSEIFLKLIKVERLNLPIYLSAGVSSAIAATFNAPLAGIIFGIEIIIGRINSYILIPLIVSTFTATLISREFIGNFAAFYVPELNYNHAYLFFSPFEALFFGILALFFLISIKRFKNLKEKYEKIWWKVVIFLGLTVAVLIIIKPEIRGVGYNFVGEIFSDKYSFFNAFFIMLFKFIATILSLGSGLFGGILSPSIFIGAFGGYFFGDFFHFLGLDPRVFALIGTAAMLSGVTKSPLRSSIIIIELTHSYQFILPILLTSAITNYIISLMEPGSYFKRALLQRGIDIDDENLINFFTVDNLKQYITKTPPLHPDDDILKIKNRFKNEHIPYIPVVDENKLTGIISLRDIRKKRFIKKKNITAKDIMGKNPFAITPDSSQEDIFKAFSIINSNYIPFTDVDKNYIGMINLNKFLRDISMH